jgi:hypothetical protein
MPYSAEAGREIVRRLFWQNSTHYLIYAPLAIELLVNERVLLTHVRYDQ